MNPVLDLMRSPEVRREANQVTGSPSLSQIHADMELRRIGEELDVVCWSSDFRSNEIAGQ